MGTLLIVERELSTGGRVRVVLGGPQSRIDPAAAEAYETAIRDAAATAEAHLLQGDAVSLETPSQLIAPGEGRAHRRRLLTALARLPLGAGLAGEVPPDPPTGDAA